MIRSEARRPDSEPAANRKFPSGSRPEELGQAVVGVCPVAGNRRRGAQPGGGRGGGGPPGRRGRGLGAGSGCVLLTVRAGWPEARGGGGDIAAAALEVAAQNARRLGVADRAELATGDWCAGLDGQFGLIVSNPPYIAGDELAGLAPEVRNHEPLAALSPTSDPGGDGLDAYRRIAAGVGPLLAPGGRLLMETGPRQAAAVSRILTDAGIVVTAILPDLDGRDRVVSAKI